MNSLVPLFILIPLGSAMIMSILGRFIKDFGKYLITLALLFLTVITFHLIINVPEVLVYKVGGFSNIGNIPVAIFMVIDGFTKILLLVISLVGFLVALYSWSYTKQYTAERKFYILFSLMLAGMYGMVISGDIFNMYVFLEIASIASYALVAFGIQKHQLEASFKYQILGGVASMLILMGIGFIYWNTGTLNIADIATQLPIGGVFIKFVAVLFIVGFGLKAAIFPFHAWLPDAHSSAPSPISAMLSGVLIKAVGIYVLFRLFFNMFALSYELSLAITVLGTLSMIIGGLLAIGQWDIKRMLAYSSISQMGYVILGVGIGMLILSKGGSPAIAGFAILGGLFHLLNHSVFKGLLFLSAGAVEYRTKTRDMKKLGGLSELMPVTSGTSMIGSLAISGIPPFNGFFSKLIIIIAAIQAKYYTLAFLAVLVSIITIGYFMKLQKFTFFNKDKKIWDKMKIKEVPFSMALSMILLAALCLGLSLLAIPQFRDMFLQPAVNSLVESVQYSITVIGN
ncbi:complex I subunit 5 family protein [Candidatus Cloacimonadota bacterium]